MPKKHESCSTTARELILPSGIAGVAYPRIGLVLQKFAWPGLLNRTCAFGSLPGDWARNATALSSLVLISVASGLKDLALKRFDATSSWPLALHCFFWRALCCKTLVHERPDFPWALF